MHFHSLHVSEWPCSCHDDPKIWCGSCHTMSIGGPPEDWVVRGIVKNALESIRKYKDHPAVAGLISLQLPETEL